MTFFPIGTTSWFKPKTFTKPDQLSMINHLCYPDTQELGAKSINKQSTAPAQAVQWLKQCRGWRQSIAQAKSETQTAGRLKRDRQYKSAWDTAVIGSKLLLANKIFWAISILYKTDTHWKQNKRRPSSEEPQKLSSILWSRKRMTTENT